MMITRQDEIVREDRYAAGDAVTLAVANALLCYSSIIATHFESLFN